jgi:hypothetical protein
MDKWALTSIDLAHIQKIKLMSGTMIFHSSWVAEDSNYPLDRELLKKYLDLLKNFRLIKEISYQSDAELAQYFTKESSLHFTFKNDQKVLFKIGDLVPDSEEFYLLQNQKLFIATYDVPASQAQESHYYNREDKLKLIHDLFSTSLDALIFHQPFKLFLEAVPKEVHYETANQLQIKENGVFQAPQLPYDPQLIADYFQQISNLEIDSVEKKQSQPFQVKDSFWLITSKSKLKINILENFQMKDQGYFEIENYPWLFKVKGPAYEILKPSYQRFVLKKPKSLEKIKALKKIDFTFSFDNKKFVNAQVNENEQFEITSKLNLNQVLWKELFKILFNLDPFAEADQLSVLKTQEILLPNSLYLRFGNENYFLRLKKGEIILADINQKLVFHYFLNKSERVGFEFSKHELIVK